MNRRAAGFTLLEVLLAVTLLAAALALGFGILRAAVATSERGEQMARRNEQMRAVSDFLRRRIGGAQGIVFAFDPQSGRSLRFAGDARSMRFVADLPDYLGRGGPHLHELQVRTIGTSVRLDVDFQLVQGGEALPAATPPEPLATGLARVDFAYRTLDERGAMGEWRPEWGAPDTLPLQVRVRIADAQGAWPDMVVGLPVASGVPALAGSRAE
ncbi:prepilin-type N-terminal cleavage/methylation domain-containing protein [Thermomonas paludicola]|uniref:prepilin-type N-terminal cleavage/methylation domain-containing protein n=1 Tax=Thermomonas paludicola TaxID=2884874 RepID=UPI0021139398|nr:prepilin-type N-terminal cleavage/methylation domain-containing protein [Thermomonas paludicola]